MVYDGAMGPLWKPTVLRAHNGVTEAAEPLATVTRTPYTRLDRRASTYDRTTTRESLQRHSFNIDRYGRRYDRDSRCAGERPSGVSRDAYFTVTLLRGVGVGIAPRAAAPRPDESEREP